MLELKASDPLVFFGAFATLIFVGFLGNFVFRKFRFNDTILLIGIGLAIGPIFNVVSPDDVSGAIGVVGALALILILFTGGLALRFRDIASGLGSSMALAVPCFAFTVVGVAAVTHYAIGASWLASVMLGCILGGTSAVVVMPSLAQMRCDKKTATILNLESAVTDIMVVVGASTLISIMVGGSFVASGVARQVITLFAMSLFFGALAGFLWIFAVPRVRERDYGYMMTLGVAFFIFVFTEWLLQGLDISAGGGPLAVLAYGIVLGNAQGMGASFKKRIGDAFGKGLQRFQGEISFLVRTFFFIYLGILVDLELLQNPFILAVGVLVFASMWFARYVSVVLSRRRFKLHGDDWVIMVMMPRGLAAAVVAAEAAQRLKAGATFDAIHADSLVAIAFLVLVLTNLLATFGGLVIGSTGVSARGPRTPAGSRTNPRPPGGTSGPPGRAPAGAPARKRRGPPSGEVAFSSLPPPTRR